MIESILIRCILIFIIHRPDSKLRYPVPLKDYHIPFQLRLGLNQGKPGEELSALLEQEVGLQTPQYPEKFASLLYIEELQMEVDIRHYDMEDAILTPEGQFLVLKVLYGIERVLKQEGTVFWSKVNREKFNTW